VTTATVAGHEANREAGQELIRRAPSGYLWNQAYSLWLYLSLFLFQLVITHLLTPDEKGVYELILTPANFAVYLAALGLESAASVYLPRALVERGHAEAAAVGLRLLVVRLLAVVLVAAGVIWGLPALAHLLAATGLPWLAGQASELGSPILLANRLVIAVYVLATGLANLLGALLTALMRTRLVFALGGIAQLLTVAVAYVFVGSLHGNAGGALLALSAPSSGLAVAYAVALARTLGRPSLAAGREAMRGMLRFGMTVWLADLANGSLIKLLAVYQLGLIVSHTEIAFFGIAFEMGHSASFLLVAGLGGVGLAIMAATYAGHRMSSLAIAWRSIAKVQVVLAVPLVAFCVPHAGAILRVLYPAPYEQAGPLLALFLVFNGLVRMAGGGASEAALYVLGRQRWVVAARWVSLLVLGVCDVFLIPAFGAAGALLAVGIAQVGVEFFELALARHLLARAYPIGFVVRVLVAVAPALVLTSLWRPETFLGLIAAGAVFALLFLLCLRLVAPLDAEDQQLLDQVSEPLRTFLRVFASRRRRAPAAAAATRHGDDTHDLAAPLPTPRVSGPSADDS
jgi:O-antigen/teichoic acid export membrane protein